MKVSELASLRSFALFGPGFSATDEFTLVTNLRADPLAPRVVFTPYEARAADALRLGGELRSIAHLDLDVEPASLRPVLDERDHATSVATIRESIAAGDVYQVNLTLRARLADVPGAALFANLCRRAIPRFAAWVRFPGGAELVSASPELFFAIEGDRVRCEPMKGTAGPRGRAVLERSTKDRSELAMITDLVRNDLTPICQPRSVRVLNARRLIELPYALQAVSDVEGMLQPGRGVGDVLEALHPGGSITGAPKNAARALISRLETSPRGAYCGSLGLVDGARATFSLLIRTAERVDGGWSYGVGGGIVWDSNAAAELEESRLKLGALS